MTYFLLEVTLSPVALGGSTPWLPVSVEPLLSSARSPATLGGGRWGPQDVVCSHLVLLEAMYLPRQCWDDLSAVNFFLFSGDSLLHYRGSVWG